MNSLVADATGLSSPAFPALKRRAKFNAPLRGKIEQHYFFITTEE
jgi:hypothetical protein